MAEKEERILCIKTYEKIAECGYGDFYNTITRQEAIEKMARAIFLKRFGKGNSFERGFELLRDEHVKFAEAALNALLGDK